MTWAEAFNNVGLMLGFAAAHVGGGLGVAVSPIRYRWQRLAREAGHLLCRAQRMSDEVATWLPVARAEQDARWFARYLPWWPA
jgi:hypothetical protein